MSHQPTWDDTPFLTPYVRDRLQTVNRLQALVFEGTGIGFRILVYQEVFGSAERGMQQLAARDPAVREALNDYRQWSVRNLSSREEFAGMLGRIDRLSEALGGREGTEALRYYLGMRREMVAVDAEKLPHLEHRVELETQGRMTSETLKTLQAIGRTDGRAGADFSALILTLREAQEQPIAPGMSEDALRTRLEAVHEMFRLPLARLEARADTASALAFHNLLAMRDSYVAGILLVQENTSLAELDQFERGSPLYQSTRAEMEALKTRIDAGLLGRDSGREGGRDPSQGQEL